MKNEIPTRRLLVSLLLMLSLSGWAEDLKLRDAFRQMPDSLLPYLTANDRLDFLDFMDSNMKAEVRNLLGGSSELTALTDDSLSIRCSAALQVDLLHFLLAQPVDSCEDVICMVKKIGTDSLSMQTTIEFFTPSWSRIDALPLLRPADRTRIERLEVQTILKRDEELLKKN